MLFYQYGYFFFALKLLEMVVDSKNSCVISSLSFFLVKLNFSLIITIVNSSIFFLKVEF